MSELVFVPIFVIAVIILVLIVYNSIVVIRKFKIETDKPVGRLRILLLSDVHNRAFAKGGARIADKIKEQSPDIIVVAGDTVDRRRPNFERARRFLRVLGEIADTYVVTGNHERALGIEKTVERTEPGNKLIDDDYRIYSGFSILGLSDTVGVGDMSHQRDLVSIFEKLDNFKIVAVHRPTQFSDHLLLKDFDIDLVLSGHTHGGAIRIPFFGAVFSPDEGLFPRYSKGLYKENGSCLVVSAGLGNTVLPIRINNFPEIVVIDVENSKK